MIIDWTKEETPEGPPIGIRVGEDAIKRRCSCVNSLM